MQLSLPQNNHIRNKVSPYIRQRHERIYNFFLSKNYYYTLLSTQFSIQTVYINEKYIFIVNGVHKIYRSKSLILFPLISELSDYYTLILKHNESLLNI